MGDEPSALVGSFKILLQQAGCRGMCNIPHDRNSGATFSGRDVEVIEMSAGSLPGTWRVESAESSARAVSRVWLRSSASHVPPTYVFDRRDGFITIRRNRVDEAGKARSLVFGVFVSVLAALDAIAHDVIEYQSVQ